MVDTLALGASGAAREFESLPRHQLLLLCID